MSELAKGNKSVTVSLSVGEVAARSGVAVSALHFSMKAAG